MLDCATLLLRNPALMDSSQSEFRLIGNEYENWNKKPRLLHRHIDIYIYIYIYRYIYRYIYIYI